MKGIRQLITVLIATLVWVSAYGADTNIIQTVQDNSGLSTLGSLIKSNNEVEDTLEGQGPFTLFAPTNEAFAAIQKIELDALTANPQLLKALLNYHVVSGNIALNQMKPGILPTLNGQPLNVMIKNDKVFINDAEIIQADIQTSNGVIHIINKVLIPSKQ